MSFGVPSTRAITVTEDPLQAAKPLIRAVCAKLLRKSAADPDVDDCVAETMRRSVESKDRRQPNLPLGPWLTGIAKHVAIDWLRARRREELRDGSNDAGGEVLGRVADGSSNPEELASRRQEVARVRSVIASLPEGPRRALLAFHVEGKAYQTIAKELGVSLGTVATWVSRGRGEVMKKLEEDGGRRG